MTKQQTLTTFPTWKKVSATRWESREQTNGTPEFVATKQYDGWRLWRRSTPLNAVRGLQSMAVVKEYALALVKVGR